ncbi:MAG TPA: hypothetical protein VMF08_21505 [Candidatus Sulfotelmatobacter sp.]|nr:hypothetical protein [Candidatus Sulfotelmatobacter sp.]
MKDNAVKNGWNAASLLIGTALLIAAGCGRQKVQVYQVSSDQDQTASAPATNSESLPPGHPDVSMADNSSARMPAGVVASDVQNASPVTWTTPPGWTSVPPSQMRVASFKVAGDGGKTADVSVVPLPGMAGGDFANVNRWRGQVGLQDAPDDVLQNSAENVEAGGQAAQLYDLAGKNPTSGQPTRILGAIQHRDGTAWFFKMTGDAELVEQQKSAFIAFLQSLNFGSQQPQAQLPPGHPDIGGMTDSSSAPQASSGQPNWTIPAGWQPVSAGQFLVAKFKINGDNSTTANVNVSSSTGDGGGLAANVNRWRGQIGLPPVDEISTVTFEIPGGQAQLVDLSGKDSQSGKPAEIIGVVVTLPGQTWFYKLMGDPEVVAAQKNAFTQFVKGAQY